MSFPFSVSNYKVQSSLAYCANTMQHNVLHEPKIMFDLNQNNRGVGNREY